MTARKLNAEGDIATSGQQFVYEKEDIAQTVNTRLSLFLGEYFRSVSEGTDWFGKILGKDKGLGVAEATIRRRISLTPGVLSIVNFQVDADLPTRTFVISCGVVTKYGTAPITVESVV